MSEGLKTLIPIVIQVTIWIALIPLLAGIVKWRYSRYGFRSIVILALLALITDNIVIHFRDKELISLTVQRMYTLLEFLAITIFFIGITSRKVMRTIMLSMLVVFSGVVVLDFTVEGLAKRDDLSVGVEALVLTIYALVTLYNILKDAEYPNILATPQFWVISAVLIYFGGNIFVFVSSNYVAALSADSYTLIWGVHALICIVFYSLLGVGLWKVKAFQ